MKQYPQIINSLIFTFCLLLANLSLVAQGFERLYVNMPDELNPILSRQNRLELLEYYKAHQVDSIKNRFKNKVVLVKFDSVQQHLIVKNTSCTTFEMKIIQRPDSTTIIGIIRTVCGPVCQSRIEFYDKAWRQIALQFKMPKLMDLANDSILNQANLDRRWVENLLQNNYFTLSFEGKTQCIIAKCNSLDFFGEADKKTLSKLGLDQLQVFQLVDSKWVRKIEKTN
jgi:hypothetical protein